MADGFPRFPAIKHQTILMGGWMLPGPAVMSRGSSSPAVVVVDRNRVVDLGNRPADGCRSRQGQQLGTMVRSALKAHATVSRNATHWQPADAQIQPHR